MRGDSPASRATAWLVCSVLLCSCAGSARTSVILATTTSVEDSGLLAMLVPAFETDHPEFAVQYTAVGSGQALEMGRRGDADVLITHSPDDELRFIAEGHGTGRREFMHNEFVLLGPPADSAGVAGTADVVTAFRRIAAAGAPFLSRGDQSGTHRREMSIWEAAGVEPRGTWYIEAGVGMGEALGIASERRAYVLSDIATWLFARQRLDLALLHRGDPRLLNQYSVIRTTRAANATGAAVFADWLVGERAQSLIAAFGQDSAGQPLFVPNAAREPPGSRDTRP